MQTYKIQRNNDVDLEFTGDLLSHVSSEEFGSTRWTTISIWRTENNRYVVQTIGHSKVPGEIQRITTKIADTPEQVKIALRRQDTIEYLTHLALDALEVAGETDERIASILVERI